MKIYPTGLFSVDGKYVDNSPRVGIRDCLRRIAAAPELVPNPEDLANEEMQRAQEECFRFLKTSESETSYFTHRVAADRVRIRMIELLQANHKPPYERVPTDWFRDDGGEPARSPIFKDMEIKYIAPIDATAVRVAGSEPPT